MFGISRLELPKILIAAPENNSMDVIEESLLQVIPLLFNVETQEFERMIPHYRRIKNEMDMRAELRAVWLKTTRRRSFPQAIIDLFQNGITLCSLCSVYRAFLIQYQRQRQLHPYHRIIIDEASQLVYSDMYVLLDNIASYHPETFTVFGQACSTLQTLTN